MVPFGFMWYQAVTGVLTCSLMWVQAVSCDLSLSHVVLRGLKWSPTVSHMCFSVFHAVSCGLRYLYEYFHLFCAIIANVSI